MKKFCVLEQGKYVEHEITVRKKDLYTSDISDYYRFNWFTDEDPLADLTKKDAGENTLRWAQGRNFLFEKVKKDYEYFIFMDEDVEVKTYPEKKHDKEKILNTIYDFLEEWNPIAAVAHTVNVYGVNGGESLSKEMAESGKPKCIKKHDACMSVLRKSFAERVFPIKHDGSDLCSAYQQWLASEYYPNKFMFVPKIFSINAIEEQHHHTDDRKDEWRLRVINGFADELIDSSKWLSNFTKDGYWKSQELLSDCEPSKEIVEATDKQFSQIFKQVNDTPTENQ